MANKIRIAGLCLIVLIIIAGFSAMSVVQSKTVSDVEKTQVEKATSNSVSLSWKKVSSADGYFIYKAFSDDVEFEKAAEIKEAGTNEYELGGLEQASEYKFYITAFKNAGEGAESSNYETVEACTLPDEQKLEALESPDAGRLKIEWQINSRAQGYQVQYVLGDGSDFSKAETITVKDKSKSTKIISKLKAKKTYSARVRSYIYYKDKMLAGKWSKVKSVKIQEKIEMPKDIDRNKPMVALTFDDGPGYNDVSDRILDVLEKYNARATFFMVGQNAKDHPKNLKRKVELGCELGNHTWNHSDYGKNVTVSDIKKCSEAIYEACGQYPTAFRSPGGNTTSTILKECKTENLALYYWSLDTQDWKSRNSEKVYNAVMNNIEDGDIVLMHEIYSSTADAVEKIVPDLIKKGYQLVTCEELVLAKTGKKPVVGQQYITATDINNKTS